MNSFKRMATTLKERRQCAYDLLRQVSTRDAVQHEIESALRMLEGAAGTQHGFLRQAIPVHNLAVFLPGNMLLYSLFLYGVIPARTVGMVTVRPGDTTLNLVLKLVELFREELPSNLEIWPGDRFGFADYARSADAVVFCGRFDTAMRLVEQACSKTIFIYAGGGVNPFIVTDDADVKGAAAAAVLERTFNSGQDCLCPDLFLVHASVLDAFLRHLEERILLLRVGALCDDDTDICAIKNRLAFQRTLKFYEQNKCYAVFGKTPESETHLVHPLVFVRPYHEEPTCPEFFSPVWNIVSYETESDLLRVLRSPHIAERAQGVSVFGSNVAPIVYGYSTVAQNCRLQMIEDGNKPFGGWGGKASFVNHMRVKYDHPVLVSRELVTYAEKIRCRNA